MASTLGLPVVCAAVLAKLQADVNVTAALPAAQIVDEVPPRPTYPLLMVEGAGETPFNTMGPATAPKWGGVSGVRVRVVSQYRGDAEAQSLLSLVKASLDGQPLTVPGYPTAIVAFQNVTLLRDAVAGIVTRELIADFDVTVHQS